ncbi:DUF4139 domain-containing protein [Breznakiella homolactica]|uniref:DUF4139 domain-containing protein n=1 Tax=Breznakiella homolactica TaxID=2798577 RepID=A0A7T8BAW7_9SPIR|nr:DUF4139 domain-containing protein [Breznakiella homolactica]QQO11179.1 DUF4139 domain-containing protein [Breznakiella homolactica]
MNCRARYFGFFSAIIVLSLFPGMRAAAQTGQSQDLPLRRLSVFSSGVAFFEHTGNISGNGEVLLPFNKAALNDALKSLVINDPGSSSPSVRYASETTLYRTLKSLKIDLSGNPGTVEILENLKGSEIQVYTPSPVSGRIIGVEYRAMKDSGAAEPYVSILSSKGMEVIALRDISSFSFMDPAVQSDFNRALDLIAASNASESRNLSVMLPGTGARNVSLSYVIPAPIWKVSYRLDLNQDKPLLQGWAIIDNDSDMDWENVQLSLVTGKPVSFIQNLYQPYYLSRPTLPLAIAGIAEARTYDSGYGRNDYPEESKDMAYDDYARLSQKSAVMSESSVYAPAAPAPGSVSGGTVTTAAGRAAGDQFEFTLKTPVTLPRQQSAMVPLVESAVKAEKVLVFSGAQAARGGMINPAISAELTNSTGMKLPAGPITVFDGGTYGGDALIEFFPENEKRLISFGDDLSVTGSASQSQSRVVTSVTVSGGVMSIIRKVSYERKYSIRNAAGEAKRLIIEHPITGGTTLSQGQSYLERTDTLYRFAQNLPAGGELEFTVVEEAPAVERITLSRLTLESFLSYTANQEIPANVRQALQKAMDLKRAADDADAIQKDIETQRTRQISEQDRIRRNLEAAGSQTQQGQEYLRRLTAMDNEIDALSAQSETARKNAQNARREYDSYLADLKL